MSGVSLGGVVCGGVGEVCSRGHGGPSDIPTCSGGKDGVKQLSTRKSQKQILFLVLCYVTLGKEKLSFSHYVARGHFFLCSLFNL